MHIHPSRLQEYARLSGIQSIDAALAIFAEFIYNEAIAEVLRGLASEDDTQQRRAIEASVQAMFSTHTE